MNPYGAKIDDDNILGPITSLNILYEGMPETKGCESCREVNGENAFWCCKTQSPSMYYVEFLKVWKEVQQWGKWQKARVIIAAITNYLSNNKDKGCVFYDDECTIYNDRPLACRMYGVIPKESWNKRWDALKERDGDNFCAKQQCNLVSTVDGKEITPEQENKWFVHTAKAERRIGVPLQAIQLHDEAGGSYRTFHDHILMELFPASSLNMLTQVKLSNPSSEDIENTAELIYQQLVGAGVI